HPMRGGRIEPVPDANLVDERLLGAIDVSAGHAVEGPVVLEGIDRAEIAARGHRERGEAGERSFVVEGRAEEGTDLGEHNRSPIRRGTRRRHPTSLTRETNLDKPEAPTYRVLASELPRPERSGVRALP